MVKIDLGCGEWKRREFIGIDNSTKNLVNGHTYKPDVLHDLNKGIPFKDNEIEGVYCSHFLEHAKNPYFILDEIHRVCRKGSIAEIIVPLLSTTPPYHLTCFYSDWFERNLDKSRFMIKDKEIKLKEFNDFGNQKNCFYELRIVLEVIK